MMCFTDALLATMLLISNHIVIYSDSLSLHSKHQVSERPALDLSSTSPAASTTKLKSGVLYQYQLLTPGLIMVLIVLFVFVLVLYFGVSALASMQISLRLDAVPPEGEPARRRA